MQYSWTGFNMNKLATQQLTISDVQTKSSRINYEYNLQLLSIYVNSLYFPLYRIAILLELAFFSQTRVMKLLLNKRTIKFQRSHARSSQVTFTGDMTRVACLTVQSAYILLYNNNYLQFRS